MIKKIIIIIKNEDFCQGPQSVCQVLTCCLFLFFASSFLITRGIEKNTTCVSEHLTCFTRALKSFSIAIGLILGVSSLEKIEMGNNSTAELGLDTFSSCP